MAGRYKRPPIPEQREQAAAARTAKLEALHGQLTEKVAELHTGEDWRAWLEVAAKFHT